MQLILPSLSILLTTNVKHPETNLNILILEMNIKSQIYRALMPPFDKKFLLQKMLLMEECTY